MPASFLVLLLCVSFDTHAILACLFLYFCGSRASAFTPFATRTHPLISTYLYIQAKRHVGPDPEVALLMQSRPRVTNRDLEAESMLRTVR